MQADRLGESQDGPRYQRADQSGRRRFQYGRRSAARDGLKNTFKGSKPAEIKDKCIEILRQAAAMVDVKAPSDAAALKGWLQQISQHVAEASKQGGSLGIGGVPVSDAEKATLREISSALKLAA